MFANIPELLQENAKLQCEAERLKAKNAWLKVKAETETETEVATKRLDLRVKELEAWRKGWPMPPRFLTITIPKDSPAALQSHLNSPDYAPFSLHSILDYPDLYVVIWEKLP